MINNYLLTLCCRVVRIARSTGLMQSVHHPHHLLATDPNSIDTESNNQEGEREVHNQT